MMTRYGSYKLLVMPFGLHNAPAIFMSIMTGVFYDKMDECVVVDIDDILMYSRSELDHARDLKRVLEKPREKNSTLTRRKMRSRGVSWNSWATCWAEIESARTRRKSKLSASEKHRGRKNR